MREGTVPDPFSVQQNVRASAAEQMADEQLFWKPKARPSQLCSDLRAIRPDQSLAKQTAIVIPTVQQARQTNENIPAHSFRATALSVNTKHGAVEPSVVLMEDVLQCVASSFCPTLSCCLHLLPGD